MIESPHGSIASDSARLRLRLSRLWVGIVVALLLCHLLLAVDTARVLSVTHDEYWHFPIGWLTWQTGEYHYDNINPPLTRLWNTLPYFVMQPQTGEIAGITTAQGYGDAFLQANPARYATLLWAARCMNILLSVLTGLLLAWWGNRQFGPASACLAVAIWCFSPNILANASLATTDIGAALLILAGLICLTRFAEQPAWSRALLFGTVLGLAQLVKFTAVLLLPLSLAVWWIWPRKHDLSGGEPPRKPSATTPPSRIQVSGLWGAALLVSLVVLNAGYLFRGTGSPLSAYQFRSQSLSRLNQWPGWIRQIPIPLPYDYVEGLDHQRDIMEEPHAVYLDGDWVTGGIRTYYLWACAYKLPHAVQLLLLLAILFVFRPAGQPREGRVLASLWLPVVALTAVASLTRMQLGLRYILPVFPFACLIAGQTLRWWNWPRRRLSTGLLAGCVAVLPFSVRYQPDHLTYFNELSGGPDSGRWHLVDSNLDWGQSLNEVREYLNEHPTGKIGLAYFGVFPPGALAIDYALPSQFEPQPGWYVISANYVQGRPHVLRDAGGASHAVGLDAFGYFRFFTPVATVGHTMLVYHLSVEDVAEWHAARQRLLR
jgi:hypothetical protein